MKPVVHIGLSFGRIEHWYDGLGEFSRQLVSALCEEAPRLADELGWRLWLHLPTRWHGSFGDAVGYMPTRTTQRIAHLVPRRYQLWHRLHQHNRLRAPVLARHRVETVHDLNFVQLKRGEKVERYRRNMRSRLQDCAAVIAITQYVAGEIVREVPGLRAPLHVIRNGVTDLTACERQPVRGVGSQPFLLHISRLAPSKNTLALLGLAAAWPEQQFILAGPRGDHADEAQRLVAARGLRNVTFRLDITESQKAWLYSQCAGFLFPSLAEGFGMPPIEAMHFGKPVFLSKLTSLPEVGGSAAHYFDSFEPTAMRAEVESGLRTAADRVGAVIEHARTFSWTRCAQDHIALYRSILERPFDPC